MIVIPMAGLSSRFFKAGFNQPKYMLEAHGKSLFDHAVCSFEAYFTTEHFIFIVRDVHQTPRYVQQRCHALGIKNVTIITLNEETRGQAETVYLGLKDIESTSELITVFNIDTFRPDFQFPEAIDQWDGYLEVFSGQGDNWSFAKPMSSSSTQVIETAEKRAISNLCCTGLYYFKSIVQYKEAYLAYLDLPQEQWEKGELYIAPLYNYLIKNGNKIHYHLIPRNEVIFCGVPDEYYDFLNSAV
ncbi:glycosyltransferase family 2 protein [Vibrio rumoiensis]|uniref:Capsular biosynthesis protein n=1 Tax=Vibrio rumoiensis 1S-45 TaxID=1188252 RepID=A0A1E5E628_9VIBR|nr:glycosyltransferase family 2 protein [Vibrio rumoiensis]OEF29480.1 capsular biosynthesis protein [Vibrio rumoiensis 1S-45]